MQSVGKTMAMFDTSMNGASNNFVASRRLVRERKSDQLIALHELTNSSNLGL